MLAVRLLSIAAPLLYLVLPSHPLGLLSGLPLGPLGLAVLLGLTGWWIALPGTPPRARVLLAALVGLGALKVGLGALAAPYGLIAEYRVDGAVAPERSTEWHGTGATRVDAALELAGDGWPVHFFNDIQRFNYYAASDPRRDLLPFTARWAGQLWAERAGRYTIVLESNGPANVAVAGATASVEQAGRVRAASFTVELPAGLHPIQATYRRPDEAMPWLSVSMGAEGEAVVPLRVPVLVQPAATVDQVRRDHVLAPMASGVDLAALLLLSIAFVTHAARVVRGASGPWTVAERPLLALYFVLASSIALAGHLHLYGKAIVLSGGNDWLAYESYARDVLLNGPLLTEGRPLGQGQPFYYQPLYVYWLALVHGLTGEGLFGPLLLNSLLGVVAGLAVYALGRELFGRLVAACALVVFELCRVTFFAPTSGLLLSENLLIPQVPVVLLLLVRAWRTAAWRWLAAAGVALGLAGLTRTTPLALLPPALLLLGIPYWRAFGWRGAATRLFVVVAACTLTVGLAAARNYVVSGRPVMITSSAGANLWEAHRPTSRVDLSRIDRDPLYERLGLDRQTREVVEFARQDPAGYVGTLAPMFLYAVGVVGAISNSWEIQPGLLGICLAYALTTLCVRRARAWPVLFVHAFVLSHLAQMTVFFSHQYGYRLILPMYVAMAPVIGLGAAAACGWIARLVNAAGGRRASPGAVPSTARALPRMVAALGIAGAGALMLGMAMPRAGDARDSFYGVNGDAALAARQALRPDALRAADAIYFAGDDSRSPSVAYLRGLAYPAMRWFDGARGMVLPPSDERALYVLPERAAAGVAQRCLRDAPSATRNVDARTGAAVLVVVAGHGDGACTGARQPIGAPFDGTARLLGIDAPASIEPGQPMDVMLHWEPVARPRERARPFARLVDSKGRRWGQAETSVYPSSSWRPGEVVLGVVRLDVEPTLPPGEYGIDVGIASGAGAARLAESGPWGQQGQAEARGGSVTLVSRSAPLSPDALPVSVVRDDRQDGVRFLGATLDREAPRPGERMRVSLFWQNVGSRLEDREVSLVLRDGPAVLREWRGVPVDGTYPTSRWKPSEVVRDTWDLIMPTSLPSGSLELAVGLAPPAEAPARYVAVTKLAVQSAAPRLTEPSIRTRQEVRFGDVVRLVGFELRNRRARPGDSLDLTLVWQAAGEVGENYSVVLYLLDGERIVAQTEEEPAGGRRPTAGWTPGEYVEDAHKLRIPRDVPRGRLTIAVGLVGDDDRAVSVDGGADRVVLQTEVVTE